MRRLPDNKTEKNQLVEFAARDFFGESGTERDVINATLWLLNRKRRVELTEVQKDAVWHTRNNLSDKVYRSAILSDLNPLKPS